MLKTMVFRDIIFNIIFPNTKMWKLLYSDIVITTKIILEVKYFWF